MSPHEVIDAYVNDVAGRLPRAKRNDVAMELKALLQEELQGKADESGRAADETMALELVRAFGSPDKVADRYRKPSFTIVPPTGTNQFVTLALGGLGLQWLITLPPAWQHAFIPGREFVSIGSWWISHGIGAFWWPGFMVVLAMIGSWVRESRPPSLEVSQWRPRSTDTDHINRPLWVLGALGALGGVVSLIGGLWAMQNLLPPHVAQNFVMNPDFIAVGGAIVTFLWAAHAVEFAIVFSEGRWRPLTRKLSLVLSLAWVPVVLWFMFGARIFVSETTDRATKGIIPIVLIIVLIDLGVTLYRISKRPRTPAALAAIAKH